MRRPVRHRARADHAEVLARAGEERGDRRGRRERDRLHPRGDGAVRPGPRELEQVVDGRPQHPPYGLGVECRLRQHGLAVAGLEELERRLLVAAHVRFEDRPLGVHGRLRHDIAHVQRVAVARHHVRPDGVARRPGPEDVAHRADHVRLHLA